jgi:hypothetical protein
MVYRFLVWWVVLVCMVLSPLIKGNAVGNVEIY